jgi:hypothetical protein
MTQGQLDSLLNEQGGGPFGKPESIEDRALISGAIRRLQAKPRREAAMIQHPTCSDCPMFRWMVNTPECTIGQCLLNPVVINKESTDFCGQHPDMPTYIAAQRQRKFSEAVAKEAR